MSNICPLCGGIIEYDSYHHAYICTRRSCNYFRWKSVTHREQLNAMTDEELADYMTTNFWLSKDALLEWLQSEVDV